MYYYKNDPIKPIMFLGILLYKFVDNKLYILLYQSRDSKYDLIYHTNKNKNNDIHIDEIIIDRVYNATNYLILLENNLHNFNDEFYNETTFTLIKFIKLPVNYFELKSTDFNSYEIITDDEKIKRELKWTELKYFNKVAKKLKNKDITKNLNKIYKNYTLSLTLNKIKLYK
jgi:hypothetical protein